MDRPDRFTLAEFDPIAQCDRYVKRAGHYAWFQEGRSALYKPLFSQIETNQSINQTIAIYLLGQTMIAVTR